MMTNFKAVLTSQGTFRVHAATCSDLKKLTDVQTTTPIAVSGATRLDVAGELFSDFIDMEEMTAEEALDDVRFLPCCGL
jgi:hypothetical protein